ncbi:MAG: 16S rRNA processing protein RimM [Clostridia bacterium]|nr:16S rRNA processing protein RimM [Clostridia bacterium]
MKQQYFEIGQIVNHFGIKGMVKVNPFTDDISQFEEMETILVDKKGSLLEIQIEEVKYSKNQVLLKLKGIDTVEDAEKYRNCYLKLPREKARKLPKNTYFIADLIGLEVYKEDGSLLGKVDDIYNTGASDIYVIKDTLGKQILLPAIKEVIKQIDLEQEKIVVHLLEGLV